MGAPRFCVFFASLLFLATSADVSLAQTALSKHDVNNHTYSCGADDLQFPLKNGIYKQRVEFGDGEHVAVTATLVKAAFGDLGEGGSAAVVYFYNSGGTGFFYVLSVLGRVNGKLQEIACLELGDRIQVNHMRIANRKIALDLTVHSDKDPACCPSRRQRINYVLRHGALVSQ